VSRPPGALSVDQMLAQARQLLDPRRRMRDRPEFPRAPSPPDGVPPPTAPKGRNLTFVDKPERTRRVEELAAELAASGLTTRVALTDRDGHLPSTSVCYDAQFLISAVSTPDVIDIDRLAPRTVLVDDSQPNCWSRELAWRRVTRSADIAPCEAGLVDAASINYWAYFPFRFAAQHATAGTSVTWCCLAEGLAMAHDPSLPPTLGEPEVDALSHYLGAFERIGFRVAPLQCGPHFLPIERLRAGFAGHVVSAQTVAQVQPVRSYGRTRRGPVVPV